MLMRILLLTAACVLLHGCATTVSTSVSVFHEIDDSKKPSFHVVPTKEQEGSLEFRSYEMLVSSELETKGMKKDAAEKADVIVFIHYGIDNGKEIVSYVPIVGQTGGGATYTSGTVYSTKGSTAYSGTSYSPPTFGIVGAAARSDTVYTRRLLVHMIDRNKYFETGKMVRVYEGKAISIGSSSSLPQIMPYMVRAIFNEFPGTNGKIKVVELPME